MTDTPPVSDFDQQLQQFRQSIDAIDEELFALILKRADIVQQVGDLKDQHDSTHVKLRPAREASQLRAIYDKFKHSPFPEASALMIWRHLINGSLMIESPLRILTLETPQALPDYAREYFGCYADLNYVATEHELIGLLQQDRADIGILPMPSSDAVVPWWLELTNQHSKLRLFLRFPYLPTACVRDGTEAIAISKIAGEVPTDCSHSALVIKVDAALSPVDLKETVNAIFSDIQWHCSNKLRDKSLTFFITVSDIIHDADDRFEQVKSQLGEQVKEVSVVGYYADKLPPPSYDGVS